LFRGERLVEREELVVLVFTHACRFPFQLHDLAADRNRDAWNNGGMPEKPKPSADDLVRMFFQLEANMTDAQMQQMLRRFSQQTYVGASAR
jgi:hypothetical protein